MRNTYPRVLIIDDEEDGRNMVRLLLGQLFPEIEIAGMADSVSLGVEMMEQLQPDILFLDMEIRDGTGFDLLSALGKIETQVIVISAHDHYALKALKASVLDFVLKPINRDDFQKAVEKALQRREVSDLPLNDMGALFEYFQHKLVIRKVKIPMLHGFVLVDVDNIIRCEASGSYTVMYFRDGTSRTICRGLSEYETELCDYGFARIHHKHLINVKFVAEYRKGKIGGGYVVMQDGSELEVSVRKRHSWTRILDGGSFLT